METSGIWQPACPFELPVLGQEINIFQEDPADRSKLMNQ
jgi:hypothetical protein